MSCCIWGQKKRSLTNEVVRSTPWCPISSCNSFKTVALYFSGRTSCVRVAVLQYKMPSSSKVSFSHSRISILLCALNDFNCLLSGLSFNWPHSITGPIFLSYFWAWQISAGKRGWCSDFLMSLHWADRAMDHAGLGLGSSTDCTNACTERDDNSSVQFFNMVLMSTGILERLSVSTFSLPGRYRRVRWKSANSATHRHPVAFCFAVDKT